MTRWFHGDDFARARARAKEFDPITEGDWYRLAPEMSWAIWKHVRGEATDDDGKRDEPGARKRFHEVAALVAAQTDQLHPGPGKGTLVEGQVPLAAGAGLLGPIPGRRTLVEVEALGIDPERDVFAEPVLGKDTQVLVEARRWERRMPAVGATSNTPDTNARPRKGEVNALLSSLALSARQQPEAARLVARDMSSNEPPHDWAVAGHRVGRAEVLEDVHGPLTDFRARGRLEVVEALRRSARARNLSTAVLVSTPQTALWRVAERRAATLYRRAIDTSEVTANDPAVDMALARIGSGQTLPAELRREMERELGISLAGARLHTDDVAAEAARAVHAEAFTVGEDIYFAAGAFAPESSRGRKLLAHELAHVAQAQGGRIAQVGNELRVSQPGESLEREADAVAERVGRVGYQLDEVFCVPRTAPRPGLTGTDEIEGRNEGEARPAISTNGTLHVPRGAVGRSQTAAVPPFVALGPIAERSEGPAVMRWADGAAPEAEAVEASLRPAGGEPLPAALRVRFEREFGCDLSAVRLHRDSAAHSAAQALHARAFTIGEHVFFLGGTPELDSRDGAALLAHELTHVVQHYQGRIALRPGFAVSRPDDPLEREAETVGAAAARGGATTPARSLMGTSTATVGGDATPSASGSGQHGGDASAPSAPSLTGFRDPAPSGGADARTGKLTGRPPSTDALIGNVPPAKPQGGKHPGAPSPKPAKHTKAATATGKPAAQSAPHAPASAPHASRPRVAIAHPPGTDAAPQLYPVPTASGGDAAGATPGHPKGAPATAADRAAARQAAAAAEQELAAHGTALATQARAAGQQVLAQIATDGDQQRQHITASAQTARLAVEPSITAQRAAITARATTEKARTAAAVATQRTAIHAAAQAQRAQATAQVAAKRQAAQAAAQQTKQNIALAGDIQANRATVQTIIRVQRGLAIASSVGAGGDADRANAQREAATKISARAVEGVQANGRELVQAAHETAAALATEVDGKLADYNHSLEQCATENEQHITKLEGDATTELDTMGQQAEQSISALAAEALSALDAHQAEMLASIEQSSSAATAHITQGVAAIRVQATTQIEQQCGQLAAAGRDTRMVFAGVQRVDEVTAVAAEARGQLDQAGAGVGQAIQGLHASTQRELAGAGSAAVTSTTQAGARGAAEASTAGAALLEKLGTLATGATASINSRGNKAQSTLVDGGQIFTQQLTKAHSQFTEKLGGLVALATTTISDKVDAGLAYQDQWIDKASSDARTTAQQIGARYDALKAQADARNATGAQRSWLSDAWDTVTGWIDSVRQWFLRTFGDFWGGLLFGILSALVVVVIGVAIGWVVGAIVGFFIASATVAAIVTAVILIGGAIAIAVYARFQEFYADNPGQSAGFWRGLGLVGLGIADITGIPYMVEGIVGQRAFGPKLTTAERTERFGMGLVFLVTFGLATWKGVKWFRGRAPSAPAPVVDPVDHPPVVDPVEPKTVDPKTVDPVDPSQPDSNQPESTTPQGDRTVDASSKVAKTKDGYRLNRKNITNYEKIRGEPESVVEADANREALAAELAASKPSVTKVYLGRDADQLINGSQGQAMSPDVVAVNKRGQFLVYEAKGMNIEHGLEQLAYAAEELGPSKVVRQTLVVPERINTPGYEVRNGILYDGGKPTLVAGKQVNVIFTTQK